MLRRRENNSFPLVLIDYLLGGSAPLSYFKFKKNFFFKAVIDQEVHLTGTEIDTQNPQTAKSKVVVAYMKAAPEQIN